MESINSELKKAVLERDMEKVKYLLSAGADVNTKFEEPPWDSKKSTFLHITDSAEIARHLILHGACVDAQNAYGGTPLYVAVRKKKGVKLIREFLKYGANVNAQIFMGDTALKIAVKEHPNNFEVIKELLKYGANIRIRSRDVKRYPSGRVISKNVTPMDLSMTNPECAKLLIKFNLIRNFDINYRRATLFDRFKENPCYDEVSRYLDDCSAEIIQMKRDRIDHNISLYELTVIPNRKNAKVFVARNNITEQTLATKYPIYYDIISDKLDLKRTLFLNELQKVHIFIFDKGKKIVMNFDCACYIAKYLSDDELYNLIKAFE